MENSENTSKKQILKATGIVGSSQIVTIILQIIRTKIIAILLGPAGVGLLGIYNIIVDMVRNLTGLGINFSGVREIAQVTASDKEQAFNEKALLLKRWAVYTGIIGGILLIIFSVPISNISFSSTDYSIGIALLSIAVLFTSLNQSQLALLQGARKLKYMAKASVIGVALSIIIVSPIYYFWQTKGMVAAIIIMSLSSFLVSQYYVSKLHIGKAKLSIKETWYTGKDMIKIGFASSISSIVTTATMYFVRSFVSQEGSLDDVGFFQASWTISNVYLLSVLNAMAVDFFPRLSAVNADNGSVNRLVNEQTEIALLVGGTLVVAMLVFSNLIICILYSEDFEQSSVLLLFFALGSFFKLLSWPICFISAAKGAVSKILISEISWNFLFALLTVLFWDHYGLNGIGFSYVISYIAYLVIVFALVDKLSSFRWTKQNVKHMIFYCSTTIISFILLLGLKVPVQIVLIILLSCFLYSFIYLNKIININELFKKVLRKE